MKMKKYFVFIALLILISHTNYAQNNTTDSLKQLLITEKSDTNRVLILAKLASTYWNSKPDSTMLLSQQGLTLARELKFSKGEAVCLKNIGVVFETIGNYPKALEILLQALKKYESINDEEGVGNCYQDIGIIYGDQGDLKQSLAYTFRAKTIAETLNNNESIIMSLINLGEYYEKLNQLDSARIYTQQAYELSIHLNYINLRGNILNNLGHIHSKMQLDDIAMGYYRHSLPDLIAINDDAAKCEVTLGMAQLFKIAGQSDSALQYARQSLTTAERGGFTYRVLYASSFLASYYKNLRLVDSAYRYQEINIAAKDTLFSQEKTRAVQDLGFTERLRQQEIAAANEQAQKERKKNIQMLGIGTFITFFFSTLFFFSKRKKNPKI
ncbi:MAG TPA: hypothetical protein VIK14_02520, partial [Ignavibacteria bacterium]